MICTLEPVLDLQVVKDVTGWLNVSSSIVNKTETIPAHSQLLCQQSYYTHLKHYGTQGQWEGTNGSQG